jgi:hypothetical protein
VATTRRGPIRTASSSSPRSPSPSPGYGRTCSATRSIPAGCPRRWAALVRPTICGSDTSPRSGWSPAPQARTSGGYWRHQRRAEPAPASRRAVPRPAARGPRSLHRHSSRLSRVGFWVPPTPVEGDVQAADPLDRGRPALRPRWLARLGHALGHERGGARSSSARSQVLEPSSTPGSTRFADMCSESRTEMRRRPENSVAIRNRALAMARPGLEPGTPRFSVVCSTN